MPIKEDSYTLWRLVPGQSYGIPEDVPNLRAFCRANNLDMRVMEHVVRGETRQYKGWTATDPDPWRTKRLAIREKEIAAMMDGTFKGDPSTEAWQKRARRMGLMD